MSWMVLIALGSAMVLAAVFGIVFWLFGASKDE